jgi:glycogen debranching enzyme GlgX
MRQRDPFMIGFGQPEPLGASVLPGGVNFAVFSEHARQIDVCLFDDADREFARLALPGRTGHVFHGLIPDIGPGQRYGLRAQGDFAPQSGHRFDAKKLLFDPYALALDRPFRIDPAMFSGHQSTDSASVMPKAIVVTPALSSTVRPKTPWARTILYETHARGFSMVHPDVPKDQRGRFAALASPAAISHFQSIGITAIEVMPLAAWIDERHLAPLGLTNYWGYNPIGFMAPDPRLVPGGWPEIAATVDALHRAGLEVIIDVVFNHSGEGDPFGPVLSLRGLDNARYYRLRPGDASQYADDAGCGNTLACDDPQVVRLVMDALRAWALHGGVDGFRFDLAATLGRRDDGFDPAAPLFAAILQDPVLRDLKLIAEAWDIGPGGYQVGRLAAPFADWNDRYRDTMRRFWRGDREVFGEAATRLSGSSDLFAARGQPSSSINFIVAHDGFTLADLVSFERKANRANGENNRDGTDANNAWNNGTEGATAHSAINARRKQDQRNLLATLLLSLGTPMLLAGSEFGQSQGGNNNAYAQDNITSWLDWAKADAALIAFTGTLTALRKTHPVFSRNRFLTGAVLPGRTSPDVVWLKTNGRAMTSADWDSGARDTLIGLLSAEADGKEQRLLICLHRGQDTVDLKLPKALAGKAWTVAVETAPATDIQRGSAVLAARSVTLFEEG